jgi:hypothetical protein
MSLEKKVITKKISGNYFISLLEYCRKNKQKIQAVLFIVLIEFQE